MHFELWQPPQLPEIGHNLTQRGYEPVSRLHDSSPR
jgi:hypothetical protein